MESLIVLSCFQARPLSKARAAGETICTVSLDLGITEVAVALTESGVRLPSGIVIPWADIDAIGENENSCFHLTSTGFEKTQLFSDVTNRLFSLLPTPTAPTMLVSGIPMHRIKGTDPLRDTREKIKTVQPVTGRVLDTATGLGYTAIEAAKRADSVATIEIDPHALEIARLNPWSQGLFVNPKITQYVGDSYDIVESFGDDAFTRIIHDPPVFSLAGHLYSSEFYAGLYRVLMRGGRLFHYVGDPDSKSGRSTTRGVIRRLGEVGFSYVGRRPEAFGVVARK
jgi:predicted methyltransferase